MEKGIGMADWEVVDGWLKLDELDEGDGLTVAFAIGYRFTDQRQELWTERFNRFKRAETKALRGGAMVLGGACQGLVRRLGLDRSRTVFIPALSSKETVARNSGTLWKLAEYCARQVGARFVGDGVRKKAHAPLHRQLDSAARKAILDEADFRASRIEGENIVIFDDFITRGATMSHIARAILDVNPGAKVYGVALGNNQSAKYVEEVLLLDIDNSHIPDSWDVLWRKGEAWRRGKKREEG